MTPIEKVARAALSCAMAQQRLAEEIRAARDEGHSLRAIAEAADMSYETVRRICS